MPKLYELPRGTLFKIVPDAESFIVPPDAPNVYSNEIYCLGNIDGMYSYCKDMRGNVVHVSACANVEIIAGG